MKLRYLTMLTLGICTISGLKAQEKSNLIKLNLWPLSVGNIALEYERSLNEHLSINGTISYRPKTNLPFKSLWESVFDDDNNILGEAKLGAFSITPEVRFYLGNKEVLKGFYIAPFVKYANYSVHTKITVDESNYHREVPLSGSLDAFTGGVAVGNQWKLGQNIYLDWRIVGPGYGFNNGKFEGKTPLNADEQREVRRQLDEFDSKLMKIKKEVNADGVTLSTSGPFAGIRTAISIGYRF
ncbi:Protein of uncharacterised function (DUF3575) [Sphingobacterium multivorum]|uniref:DUF3575 domain-containing protein n=1 Tax=Sphingobacterium multivorum TaxID=28454 RepID=UPI000DFEA2A2|nr:DUF3575 domain-containing protein [Sphingobacterium multivorum]QQT45641.1 DUF3575 domain-containing protein [Sphingobacterium multivorum]SUJ27677.1 Protein of uncharacterised function (DUF3575) [Sphingobacterium multivorum]